MLLEAKKLHALEAGTRGYGCRHFLVCTFSVALCFDSLDAARYLEDAVKLMDIDRIKAALDDASRFGYDTQQAKPTMDLLACARPQLLF